MKIRIAALFIAGATYIWAQSYTISTFAGAALPPLPEPALDASVGYTTAIVTDSSGNIYWAGGQLHSVFQVSPSGILAFYAGNGHPGYSGDNGPAVDAQLYGPCGVAVDGNGNVYISDSNEQRVRKVSPSGVITTFAGNGIEGYSGDNGPAVDAELNFPCGVAVDGNGNVYIADSSNVRIREVSPTGMITTIAGNGDEGETGDNGPALEAELSSPQFLAADASGNVYITDTYDCKIRKISTSGIISTVAGNGVCGYAGDGGGAATSAEINSPRGIAVDGSGNLYIADGNNYVVREVYAAGTIATIAGNGIAGYAGDGGPATSAKLVFPLAVTLNSNGNLYILDDYRIRKVNSGGTISTVAGNSGSTYSGDGGPATIAQLAYPIAGALDSGGNLYFTDSGNNRVRMISVGGTISTVAGNGTMGYAGDNGPAVDAEINDPGGIAFDADGNLYIADSGNHVIRKVSGGIISTYAGNGTAGDTGDGGSATSAEMEYPFGLTVSPLNGNLYTSDAGEVRIVSTIGRIYTAQWPSTYTNPYYAPEGLASDSSGNVYIADAEFGQVLQLTPDENISTFFGGLSYPTGVAMDANGNFYVTETNPSLVTEFSGGQLTAIAGTGTAGYSGDGGPATSAQLSNPSGVTLGLNGTIYIMDTENSVIRQLTPCIQSLGRAVSADATAQTVSVAITAAPVCRWSAASLPSWIASVSSGMGSGTLAITLEANTTGADRTGTFTVNGLAVSVTQYFTAQVFADVPPGTSYFNAVDLLSQTGITNGCSATPLDYCPSEDMDRADAAVFIVRTIYGGTDNFPYSTTPYFTDVSPTDFGFPWIQHLYELGITTGCAPQLFCPNNPLTRAQLAIFIIRMRYGSTAAFDYPATPYFNDVGPGTFGWAWIQRMGEDNITSGCGTKLYCPDDAATRADAAVFIMRAGFNELLPATEPILSSISPATIAAGATDTFTVTGVNTQFVQGTTTIAPIPGITVGTVTVTNPTTLTVELTASAGAVAQPVSVLAITGFPPGNEEAVLPNGLVIQ